MLKESRTVEIVDYAHLGDCITALILLNSTGIRWSVKGQPIVKCLIDLLEFNLDYEEGICYQGNTSISDILKLPKNDVYFLNLKFLKLNFGLKIKEIKLASFETNPTRQFFQVDPKSDHELKPLLSRLEQINLIRMFDQGKATGIGGEDTEKIDDRFEYLTGNIEEIIQWMKICNQFFGVDSGMAHIAGFLKIPSEIVITHIRSEDVAAIKNFFAIMYPTVKCWDRKVIISKIYE